MLAKRFRLSKQDGVLDLLRNGSVEMNGNTVIRHRPNTLDRHRFGVIVSKKMCKLAVDRNRIRRQCYEIVRHGYDEISSKRFFDVLILPKKAMMDATSVEKEQSILNLLKTLS